jgi:ribosomal protein S18 acetylase RimI-like enzyme
MGSHAQPLEFRKLSIEWKQPLLDFLRALQEAGDSELFHPHPFTEEAIDNVIKQVRKDVYCVLVEGQQILGYGMLRGWDEGYDTPSLGIAIHPSARATGLGKVLMYFLHAAARRRGATKVRLRVKPDNSKAIRLYEALGYEFHSQEAEYLVGTLDLNG